MANPYINLYMNNPTAGETDGTAISTDGTQLNPLSVTLNATNSETKIIKLGIRTESGYTTDGDVVITDNNDTNDRWKFSLTENGAYSDSVTISAGVSTVNTIFYAQASSATSENPSRDTSVSIKTTAKITAA